MKSTFPGIFVSLHYGISLHMVENQKKPKQTALFKIILYFFTFNMSATIHYFPFMFKYFNLNSCSKYLYSGKAPGHFPEQNLFFLLCFIFLDTSKSVQFQTPRGPLLLGCTQIPLHPSGCLKWDSMWGNFLLIPTLKQNVK